MIVEMEHIQAGRIKTAGIPLKFSDVECIIERPAPLLGQHSQEVFKEFGLVTRKLLNYSLELLSRLMQPNIETDVTN